MSDDSNFGMDDIGGQAADAGNIGVGVIRIGKRDYAVGLHWNSVETPANAAKEAREMATSQIPADYFCVRSGTTTQFGLGFKAAGHKSNMPSLAAHLAAAKSGSWIGLFDVPGGYYLIAVRDDGVIAETDRFFADAAAAQEEFDDLFSRHEWGECFGPSKLDIPGTREESLPDLVAGKPPARLKEVKRSGAILRLGAAVALIGGALIGGMYYMDLQEQERLRLLAEEQARKAREMFSNQPQQIEIPPMPWEGKPLAVPTLVNCVKAAKTFPGDIPGWKVVEVFCEGGSVAVALDRAGSLGDGGGSVTWIAPYVNKPGFTPQIDFPREGSGTRVRVQWNLPTVPTIPVQLDRAWPQAKPVKIPAVKSAIQQVLESRMTPVSFAEADNTDFWRGLAFKFSTGEDPTAFGDLLGALPGAIITRIHLNVETGAWDLEGKIYEQLPPPPNAKVKRN